MERNIRELAAALRRGALVAMILPDHPEPGRAFSDAGITLLRKEAGEAAEDGQLQVFCLGASTHKEDEEHYRPIYVHAKIAVVDDVWSTVGSANLNNRGMRDDTEINVAVLDPELSRGLRLMLWAEHLGLATNEDLFAVTRYLSQRVHQTSEDTQAKRILDSLEETLGDPLVGLRLMRERAEENLQRYKVKQPLVGHILPYLTGEEATQQGLPFREEHGWLEEPPKSS
jgi:phosphatidylserine/phosphatidylglycerophosphate/cardiolipin synthase-like enzyme